MSVLEEGSANWKVKPLKSPSLRSRNTKNEETRKGKGELGTTIGTVSVHTTGIPEGGERERGVKIFEGIMAPNSPNGMNDMNLYVQESQQFPSRTKSERSSRGHVLISLSRAKVRENLYSRERGY